MSKEEIFAIIQEEMRILLEMPKEEFNALLTKQNDYLKEQILKRSWHIIHKNISFHRPGNLIRNHSPIEYFMYKTYMNNKELF
jgi:hypothetical protein